jgi:hypothetical protein
VAVKTPTRCNSVLKLLLSLILNEAQHVSGDTTPIIRILKLQKQPLVLHTWKDVGRPTTARPTSKIKILLFLILNEAQQVSGDTTPIIRSLKLHKQPLVLHTWKDFFKYICCGSPHT